MTATSLHPAKEPSVQLPQPCCPGETISVSPISFTKPCRVFPQWDHFYCSPFSRCSCIASFGPFSSLLSHIHIWQMDSDRCFMQILTPLFCFCFSFPDNNFKPPQRPLKKPLHPAKGSKQLPPEPSHMRSDEVNHFFDFHAYLTRVQYCRPVQ